MSALAQDVSEELTLAADRLMSLLTAANRHVENESGLKGDELDVYLAIDYAMQRVIGDIRDEAKRLISRREPRQ